MKPKQAKKAVVVVATATEKETAAELVQAGLLLGELAQDYFGAVRDAVMAGCTFEGLEAAEPDLKAIGAYRSAKSVIVNAKKQGKKLLNGDGTPKTKNAIAAELAPSGTKGERKGKGRGGKAKKITPNKIDTLQTAFAILKAEPSMRKAYRTEIMETARMLANDEASRKAPVRVSAQRRKLAEGAAVVAQQKAA